MSMMPPTAEFLPFDISDDGLTELRRLALSAADAAPKFSTWLHSWCDAEQARRAKHEDTCTSRHACGIPLMQEWSNRESGEALEAVGVLVHAVREFTGSQFAERLQMAISMECGLRLRTQQEPTTDAS